jgi:hypothetical protein
LIRPVKCAQVESPEITDYKLGKLLNLWTLFPFVI